MNVKLLERNTNRSENAIIEKVEYIDELPLKKDAWNFNWRELFRNEEAFFYKITVEESSSKLEGILMLSLLYNEMIYMNNIEIAPHNYGKAGIYKNVAACLMAYACYQSFQHGKGNYRGFLSFDSKTELLDFYQNKYGATRVSGQKMFINSEVGIELIKTHLQIEISDNNE